MWFFFQKDRAVNFFLTVFVFVCLFLSLFLFVCLFRFLKSKNWVLTFYLPCFFFIKIKDRALPFFLTVRFFFWKVRIKFLPFSLPLGFFVWKVMIEFLLLFLTMWLFFSRVRIEFLPFSLPCLFVCLFLVFFFGLFWFLKSKNWVLTFYLSCDFFFKGLDSYLFPYRVCLFDCFFVYLILFVCLGFWKVRIEFLPFTYHVIFFQK